MKFREFSKNLSDEIENLFVNLGGSCLPEEAHRLDETVSIQDILERVKNLDIDTDKVTDPSKPASR
ncbi:hypothetical protein DWB84_09610 [Saccharophagus sp. K07]|uniref:hypothetical protein n=1 Tax=Saccharophagus sp. K07 TaxID=2283636 RepID=UPI0016528CE3|nr:hypothetical protein [Saccharophagus sp. K07]MBC6905711.1 hypothetical protein [Saccharophagus sp. K07]